MDLASDVATWEIVRDFDGGQTSATVALETSYHNRKYGYCWSDSFQEEKEEDNFSPSDNPYSNDFYFFYQSGSGDTTISLKKEHNKYSVKIISK